MSGAEIANFLKNYGNGDELTGVANVFLTGVIAGVGGAIIFGAACYSLFRLGKWGYKKANQHMMRSNHEESILLENM